MINNSNPGLACQFSMKYAFKFSDFTNDELWVLLRWVEVGKPINQQRSWKNNKCCFELFQMQKRFAFLKQ
jgi:hypothetical protein